MSTLADLGSRAQEHVAWLERVVANWPERSEFRDFALVAVRCIRGQ